MKTAFGINFRPPEGPKLENNHFHFNAFSGWGTSWCQKINYKISFLIKSYLIKLNIFSECFDR